MEVATETSLFASAELGVTTIVLAELDITTQEMAACLTGFWAADKWDMAECPLLPAGTEIGHTFITFDIPSASLRTELKYACWRKFNGGGWSPKSPTATMCRVRAVIRFLKEMYPDTQSLVEKELDEWHSVFQAYLEEKGLWRGRTVTYLDRQQNYRRYESTDARVSALNEIYKMVLDARDSRPEHEKDIWDVRKMGANLTPADVGHSLNFTRISQPWLRQATKRYLRYRLSLYSLSSCRWTLNALDNFSAFLEQHPQQVQPSVIDRFLITEYLSYLATVQPGARARQQSLTQLRLFLETCAREGWADFPEKRLIFEEDIPHSPKHSPRTIPEHVLEQLNQHLDAVPEPYRTMVLVLQGSGLRISELCSLARNCLVQDQDGDWFLHHFQWKMKKDHSIPIHEDLAAIIQQQQQIVSAKWGNECSWLFPNRKGNPIAKYLFARALNQLAVEKDIRDSTGQVFRFRAHDFRHTVATQLLRGGVRQHHVQKYLGHESPGMTMVYAEITDQDLKQAYNEYQGVAVDVTGKVVTTDQVGVDSADLQWFKKNIMAQALPHGFCALPTIAEPCPVPNACFTCANFRTNASFLGVLKAELAATKKLIGKAKANNWSRQVEMNERVAANLNKIIISLEEACNDPSKKC